MRVLVVEDDVRMAAAIRRGLRNVNAVGDVATTSNGACTMLADGLYDVIVLDVMLPDADGFHDLSTTSQRWQLDTDHHAHRPRRKR